MARIFKRGNVWYNVWYIDFYHNGKRIRKRASRDKKTALRILYNTIVKIEQNESGLVNQDASLFNFIKEYLNKYALYNKKPSTLKRDKQAFEHLKDYFGNIKLKNITPQLIEGYKEKRLKEKANPATVNLECGC